jgi:DNA-binding NarL/FixJ family response regulator
VTLSRDKINPLVTLPKHRYDNTQNNYIKFKLYIFHLENKGAEKMAQKEKPHALILEKDRKLIDSIEKILKRRSYAVTTSFEKEVALQHLKERTYPLAVVGDAEGSGSPFEAMRDIVMASPMTSMVLITDLPEDEVNEKAEGYGILGHVSREVRSKDLLKLVKSFEAIFTSFAPARK